MSVQISVNPIDVKRIDSILANANNTLRNGESSGGSGATGFGRTSGFTFMATISSVSQSASGATNRSVALMETERQRIHSIYRSFSRQDARAASEMQVSVSFGGSSNAKKIR
jgi:hypothetical protein